MKLLNDREWQAKYSPEHGDLVQACYLPALQCAIRYDRSTGFFNAYALALAARGVEGLIGNGGKMRLVVGCTLRAEHVTAIEQGAKLRDTAEAAMLAEPLQAADPAAIDALALLAWMIAKGHLDVKVAVPCDAERRPVAGPGLFHEKAGIIEDAEGNRLAFSGSLDETEQGWKHHWAASMSSPVGAARRGRSRRGSRASSSFGPTRHRWPASWTCRRRCAMSCSSSCPKDDLPDRLKKEDRQKTDSEPLIDTPEPQVP